MIFEKLKRWFNRSRSSTNRSPDGTEGMFVAPVVAPAFVNPSEPESDDTEAVEGKSVDSNDISDTSAGESSCGASCGAMYS